MLYDKGISIIQEGGKQVSLIALAIPLLLEGVFTLLNGTVNTIILSGYSDMAVSATGVALQLYCSAACAWRVCFLVGGQASGKQ